MFSAAQDIIAAHGHCTGHRTELLASSICGCFYCLATFKPEEIEDWVDWPPGTPEDLELESGTTALCPRCGIDAVIGSESGYPINKVFLDAMHAHWF
jgi:hypothetical protein